MTIERLDGALLDRIERACHFTQVVWDMTCFVWARLCHVAILALLSTVMGFSPQEMWSVLGPICAFAGMYGTIFWATYGVLEKYYAEVHDVAHPITAVYRSMVQLRAVIAVAVPLLTVYGLGFLGEGNIWVLVYVLLCVFWLASLYLQSCVPLPKGDVKSRQLERERLRAHAPEGAIANPA